VPDEVFSRAVIDGLQVELGEAFLCAIIDRVRIDTDEAFYAHVGGVVRIANECLSKESERVEELWKLLVYMQRKRYKTTARQGLDFISPRYRGHCS
jgi:hypothetical protein